MIKLFFIAGLFAIGGWWLVDTLLTHSGETAIGWSDQIYYMTTATLALAILLICIVFSVLLWFLSQVLGLGKRLRRMRDNRLTNKASRNLTQGLIQLAEGHWDKAEKLLTDHVDYSETPLLNYLTAARAAHMQHHPQRRDELLHQAIASDSKAKIAVGVSQAEMQLGDKQLEQANATLLNLRGLAPKNSYVLKLYAKTLYQQHNWDELVKLLPELVKHGLLNEGGKNMHKIQTATLQGAFDKYAEKKASTKLQMLWQKLPSPIKSQPSTAELYAKALHRAQADALCAEFITETNNKTWNSSLTGLFGRLTHQDLRKAATQAEKWLKQHPDNPICLLLMARLCRQQQLWGQAKTYYETSLNQAPDTEAYLELAELLETMGEKENAQQCYQIGLRYGIRAEGERLTLTKKSH